MAENNQDPENGQGGFDDSQKLEFGENAGEGFSQDSQQTEKGA